MNKWVAMRVCMCGYIYAHMVHITGLLFRSCPSGVGNRQKASCFFLRLGFSGLGLIRETYIEYTSLVSKLLFVG